MSKNGDITLKHVDSVEKLKKKQWNMLKKCKKHSIILKNCKKTVKNIKKPSNMSKTRRKTS